MEVHNIFIVVTVFLIITSGWDEKNKTQLTGVPASYSWFTAIRDCDFLLLNIQKLVKYNNELRCTCCLNNQSFKKLSCIILVKRHQTKSCGNNLL